MASCALTIGSPPVWPKSYDRNSDPRNVASDGALSEYNNIANHAIVTPHRHNDVKHTWRAWVKENSR